MNIIYIHGFGSAVDPESEKYRLLKTLAQDVRVHGIAPDYTKGFEQCKSEVLTLAHRADADLIVGTSMGGVMASHCGAELGIPFFAVNPPYKPSETLKKYLNMTQDYYGRPMHLTAETVSAYQDFLLNIRYGKCAFALGDEVLDHSALMSAMDKSGFDYVAFKGGDHRFSDFQRLIAEIKYHFSQH